MRRRVRGNHEINTNQADTQKPAIEETAKPLQGLDEATSNLESLADTNADLAPKRARSEYDAPYGEQSSPKRRAIKERETELPTNGSQSQAEQDDTGVYSRLTPLEPYIVSVRQDDIPTVALFVNEEGYDEVRNALFHGRRVRKLRKKMKKLEGDIKQAGPLTGFCQAELNDEKTSEERKAALHEEIKQIEETKAKALAKKSVLGPKLEYESGLQGFLQQSFLGRIQNAMINVGVLEVPSADNEEDDTESEEQERPKEADQERPAPEGQAEDEISIGELRREEAREGIINARIMLGRVMDAFEARFQNYREQFEGWHRAMMNGATSETRTEFDVNDLLYCQRVTHDLINAQEAYKAAKQHAREVHSQGGYNSFDRESIFFNHPRDGYYSWEPEEDDNKSNGASKAFIHRWVEDVVAVNEAEGPGRAEDGDENMLQQPDPHVREDIDSPSFMQARSLSFAVSIGDIDQSWRREKIDDWNALCGRDR